MQIRPLLLELVPTPGVHLTCSQAPVTQLPLQFGQPLAFADLRRGFRYKLRCFTSDRRCTIARYVLGSVMCCKFRLSATIAPLATVGALAGGCSLTLGPTATSVLTQPRSQHLGASVAVQTRLPREYSTIVGIEESLLGQLSPESHSDQWRVAGLLGYSRAPTAGGTGLGWEGAVRAGFFRGSNGNVIPAGGLLGAKLAAPIIRLTAQQDPWERNDLLDKGVLMLVPEFGINTLWSRAQDVQLEVTAMLALRVYLSTTLVP